MANYDSAIAALGEGDVIRRQLWEGKKALIGIKLGKMEIGYAVVILENGSIHGDDNKILRYIFSDEDLEATDWEYKDCRAVAVPRDKRQLQ